MPDPGHPTTPLRLFAASDLVVLVVLVVHATVAAVVCLLGMFARRSSRRSANVIFHRGGAARP